MSYIYIYRYKTCIYMCIFKFSSYIYILLDTTGILIHIYILSYSEYDHSFEGPYNPVADEICNPGEGRASDFCQITKRASHSHMLHVCNIYQHLCNPKNDKKPVGKYSRNMEHIGCFGCFFI